jgi:hypothetical protein
MKNSIFWVLKPCSALKFNTLKAEYLLSNTYRVIQEELPPRVELISEEIFKQKVSYKPGSYTQYLQSYVRNWNFSKFKFKF